MILCGSLSRILIFDKRKGARYLACILSIINKFFLKRKWPTSSLLHSLCNFKKNFIDRNFVLVKVRLVGRHAWLIFWLLMIIYMFIGIVNIHFIVIFGMLFSSFICNNGTNFIMCPVCDKNCRYWNISETCFGSKITYLFDNNFSVVFAFLLSVWGKLVMLIIACIFNCFTVVYVLWFVGIFWICIVLV